MKEQILTHLPAECPWGDTLHWFHTITSTNDVAKEMAKNGAPQGTVVIAGQQSGGRGRMGRSFSSPAEKGVYLSVILRPNCPAQKLMTLTCAVGVAMCNAVEQVSGVRPKIKWINDLILENRKLGGILTELCAEQGIVTYAIVGVGINCDQAAQDFPPEIRDMAISLKAATEKTIDRAALAGAMVEALWKMERTLFSGDFMADYQKDCITLGQTVSVVRGDAVRHGKALTLTQDGGLLVEYPDHTTEIVQSGEVSIRGMYGYL